MVGIFFDCLAMSVKMIDDNDNSDDDDDDDDDDV
jgi:hypothetical protein